MNCTALPPRRATTIVHCAFVLGGALVCSITPSRAQPPFPRAFNPSPRDEFVPSNRTPVRVFFPPEPPPLDGGIPPGSASAPAELAAYVNETFYPSLGTRLDTKTLNARLRSRLEQYHATKLVLQNELRAELDRLRNVEPAARVLELTALSGRQTPKLVELEAAAEQLRLDLTSSDEAWGALREWSLGDGDRRGYSPLEVAQVMRASAYYQSGLSLAQRGLLREIAIELQAASDSTVNVVVAQPYLFFSPAPARVLLPDDLPADAASKLATYETRKSALKKELYDSVYAHDGKTHGFLRGNPLKTLAEKQAMRLAELETLAEEIRRSLADFAKPNESGERSPLPPRLQSRVSRMVAGYLAAQREAAARIDTIFAAAKDLPMRGNYRFDGERLVTGSVP